jgi:hypothetical protein
MIALRPRPRLTKWEDSRIAPAVLRSPTTAGFDARSRTFGCRENHFRWRISLCNGPLRLIRRLPSVRIARECVQPLSAFWPRPNRGYPNGRQRSEATTVSRRNSIRPCPSGIPRARISSRPACPILATRKSDIGTFGPTHFHFDLSVLIPRYGAVRWGRIFTRSPQLKRVKWLSKQVPSAPARSGSGGAGRRTGRPRRSAPPGSTGLSPRRGNRPPRDSAR